MNTSPSTYVGSGPFLDRHPVLARALFIAALVTVLAASATWVARFASVVTDENWYTSIDGRVTIIDVASGGASDLAGLRVGDVIVAINGHPVKGTVDANNYLVEGTKGGQLIYTIERDGKSFDVRVILAALGMPVFYFAFILTGLLFIGTGAFVFLRRTGYPTARLYGWATLVIGFAFMLARAFHPLYYPDLFTAVMRTLEPFTWIFGMSLLVHLLLYFPVRAYTRKYTWHEFAWIYGFPLGLSLVFSFLIYPQIRGSFPSSLVLPLPLTVAVFTAVYRVHRRLRDSRNPEYGEKSLYVRVAWALGLVLLIISTQMKDFAPWQAVFLLLTATPMLFFYTIVKYRIFDLYIVVRKSSMYTSLVIGLIALCLVLFFGVIYVLPASHVDLPVLHVTSNKVQVLFLGSLSEEHRAVFERRMFLTFGVALLLLTYVVYRRGRGWLDTRFHRGSYDYRVAMREFSQLSRRYSDKQSLADSVVRDLANIMHLKGVTFALREDNGFRVLATNNLASPGEVFEVGGHDDEQFEKLLERASSQAFDNLPIGERFARMGVEFVTPIVFDKRIEAIILLGEKEAETNFTREDVDLLDNLAISIADALMTMDFYEGAKEKERMRRELELARRIQLSALPAEIPDLPGIEIAAESVPAHEVGGDFYDFLPHHDTVTLIVGDVSGKGMPAALYLARIQGVIKTIASFKPTLWELFVRLNTQIFEHVERNTYLTMAGLQINLFDGAVRYLRAGHLPLLHFHADTGSVEEVRTPGIGIGLDHVVFSEQLEEQAISTARGDVLLLITDGVTEAANERHEQYGIERVMEVLRLCASHSADHIRQKLFEDIASFAGTGVQHDDLTVIVVKVTG